MGVENFVDRYVKAMLQFECKHGVYGAASAGGGVCGLCTAVRHYFRRVEDGQKEPQGGSLNLNKSGDRNSCPLDGLY